MTRVTRRLVRLAGNTLLAALLLLICGCATSDRPTVQTRYDDAAQVPEAPVEANARTLYAMARVLMHRGKLDQAEIVLLRLVNEFPTFAPAYADLAELRMKQGRTEEARLVLERGVERFPDDAILRNDLGVCELAAGRHEAALGHFEAAAAQSPRDPRFQANRAAALALNGREVEAREVYRQFLGTADTEHNLAILSGSDVDADMSGTLPKRD